jgi:hypothetical protein
MKDKKRVPMKNLVGRRILPQKAHDSRASAVAILLSYIGSASLKK